MAAKLKPVSLLRQISHELRRFDPERKVRRNEAIGYMVREYRKHDVTTERTCREADELRYLGETYYCYLNSSRKYRELYHEFHGKIKERSTEEAAALVGLRVPILYEEPGAGRDDGAEHK